MITIESTDQGDVNEIALDGRLDVNAANEVDAAFAEAVEKSSRIVLDMTNLEYIASAGLRAIKRLRMALREKGGTLVLRGVQDDVMEVFEMTGFAAMLTFED